METACHGSCFEPLAGADETRVLHLASAKSNDPLSGRLECISLERGPSYEALSYEWGSAEKKQNILLENGSMVHITDSLYHALRDIRHETLSQGSRVVWADGICINQDDLMERQQQVSIMGAIYRRATRVITYIGPEKDNSSSAINFADELWQYSLTQTGAPDSRLHSVEELVNIGLPPASDPRWAALKALFLRGWSNRCWCAQEFLLNTNLIMMCGRVEVPKWSLIPNLVQLVFNRALPIFLLPQSLDDPSSLRECLASLGNLRKHIVYNGQQVSLRRLLVSSHAFRTTDPRDKVYSLLGLASDREDIALPVDYALTCEQLYIRVATRILEKSISLAILYSNLGKKSLNLPSWVPDWSTWQFGSHGAAFGYYYSASGPTTPDVQISTGENRLDITGCLVDRIVWLSGKVGPYYRSHPQVATSERDVWLKEQIQHIEQLEPYPDGSKIYDVFWRTLIGNITFNEHSAQDAYKAYFEAHLNVQEDSSTRQKNMAREFCDAVRRRARYRCLAVTEKGYFGAIPETAENGDWVCMFHGERHLFLVRPMGSSFAFIGHAYIHGLMSGEILHLDWYKKRTISLL